MAKFNTKSISNRGAFCDFSLAHKRKMYKTSVRLLKIDTKIPHQKRNFLVHRVQNVPENLAKWLHFKTDHALRREKNKVKFLEGRFVDEKLPFLHKKKTEHSHGF